MNNIIEEYYNNFNYPSIDKLYKLLKADGHDIKKKDIESYLNKQQEAQVFKEAKKNQESIRTYNIIKTELYMAVRYILFDEIS